MEGQSPGPSRSSTFFVILAVLIVIVGGLSIPLILIGLEKEVTGQVVDSNGDPIPGAKVISGRGSTLTNEDGRYSLKVFDAGQVILRAEADGHWTQKKEMMVEGGGARVVDFTLIDNIETQIPIGAIYLSLKEDTNLNGTIELSSSALHTERWIQVGDYASGGRDDFSIIFGLSGGSSSAIEVWTYYFNHYNASSFIEVATVTVSGVYWDTPGECENCYVIGWTGVGNDHMVLNAQDYLMPSAAQGEQIFNSDNRGGVSFFNSPFESYQIDGSLGAKVSVSILGKQFNCTLPVTFGPATDGAPYVEVMLFSMSDDPTMVKSLVEGGHILHLWEVDA